MKRFLNIVIFIFLLIIIKSTAEAQFYSGSQMTFGKSRVQYNDFFWSYYKFERFDTYFTKDGKNIAIYTAKYAQQTLNEFEKLFDFNLDCRIEFIIYNKQSELRQSNIGFVNNEPYNTGGYANIIDTKIFIYFDGNHANLQKQIRAGIAQLMIYQMLYGTTLTAVIKNSTLLSLPDWYINGLVSYLSEDWNISIDNKVRDAINKKYFRKFNRLTGKDAILAGHSIWYYIAQKYNKQVISNIIYITKVSKNIESGFIYTIGLTFNNLVNEWQSYYSDNFFSTDSLRNNPKDFIKLPKLKKFPYYGKVKINPEGNSIAYTTNESGLYKIWTYNTEKRKRKKLFKRGFSSDMTTDYSYPLIAWHPSGELLASFTEEKGKIILRFFNIKTKEKFKREFFHFDKILDFSYSDDGKKLVLSAVKDGQSDIFIYNISSFEIQQITNDEYDDLNPHFTDNSQKIIFSSNRTNDTLKTGEKLSVPCNKNKDIFLYNITSSNPKILQRLTNTPNSDEINPLPYDKNYYMFLSNNNGIYNRYISSIDSSINYIDTTVHYRYFPKSFPVTNYERHIIEQDIDPVGNKIAEVIYNNGLYNIFLKDKMPALKLSSVILKDTYQKKNILSVIKQEPEKNEHVYNGGKIKPPKIIFNEEDSTNIPDSNRININDYTFDKLNNIKIKNSEKKYITEAPQDTIVKKSELKTSGKFILPIQRNYDLRFSINQIVGQVDFSYLNSAYQRYTGNSDLNFANPGFNLLFKLGISDLFDDYRVTGGVRLNLDLVNNEYLLSFENLKNRLDHQWVFHRQGFDNFTTIEYLRIKTNEVSYITKYPFNDISCIKGTLGIRDDKFVHMSADINNLVIPDHYENWANAKLEYIFDNTKSLGLNLMTGTRCKVFTEYFKHIEPDKENFVVAGIDFRKYLKIHRNFIWANRFSASTSISKLKLLYYLGGVDNWIQPKFENNATIDPTISYLFQSIATPLRGFSQNIRNGYNFALINSELRFPVFKYFANRPIRSDFINNFMVVGFTDIGSTWNGLNPYDEKNALHKKIYQESYLKVTLINQTNPIVAGYGFGLRSRLLGYYIRLDWAWGVEDGQILDKMLYFSLSLDF